MQVIIDIPTRIEEQLRAVLGPNLSQVAKLALAIEGYRTEALSLGQVAELLEITVCEADGFLKQRGVENPHNVAEFERDRASLKKALAE